MSYLKYTKSKVNVNELLFRLPKLQKKLSSMETWTTTT